jgi:hypothetical protein
MDKKKRKLRKLRRACLPRKKQLCELARRVFCPECGQVRLRNAGSRYAVCPNGHGKLVRRFDNKELRMATIASLPRAFPNPDGTYTVSRRTDRYCFEHGDGCRPVMPGAATRADQIVAWIYNAGRLRVRVFTKLGGQGQRTGENHAADVAPNSSPIVVDR